MIDVPKLLVFVGFIDIYKWLKGLFQRRRITLMTEQELILDAMRKAGEPLNAGKIAELTGLDRKVVDKTMTAMKKDGSIVSPVRCKWEPAEN